TERCPGGPDSGKLHRRRFPRRPRPALDRLPDHNAVRDDLVETDLASKALGEGVRCDQACLSGGVEQVVSPQREVGSQVGAAASGPRDGRDKVFAVGGAEGAGELLPTEERRVADDGVEATLLE